MSRRRKDKFMQEMGRIRRARQRRRARRGKDRLLYEDKSPWQESWEDFTDSFRFQTQQFSALGKEVARGVTRESGTIARDILKAGTGLTLDVLAGVATLGLTEQPMSKGSRSRRRPRRGR